MADQEKDEAIRTIKRYQENFAVGIGFIIAITLSVYFFTYAVLADKGMTGMLWAQSLSAIAMVLILIRLKRVAFFCTRFWLGRRQKYRQALASMTIADLSD